jgi:hypothetical protein
LNNEKDKTVEQLQMVVRMKCNDTIFLLNGVLLDFCSIQEVSKSKGFYALEQDPVLILFVSVIPSTALLVVIETPVSIMVRLK